MATRDKIYAIPTPPHHHVDAAKVEPGLTMQLPAELIANQTRELVLSISDDLDRWAEAGRVYEVILRLRLVRATEQDKVNIRLNGAKLPTNLLRRIDHLYQMNAPRFRSHSSYWYVFKLDREHWPLQGQNRLDVALDHRDPEATPEIYVRDVQLEIRYLRGKSVHRGPYNTNPDLEGTLYTGSNLIRHSSGTSKWVQKSLDSAAKGPSPDLFKGGHIRRIHYRFVPK